MPLTSRARALRRRPKARQTRPRPKTPRPTKPKRRNRHDHAPAPDQRVALAAVAGAHGITGEVRLKSFAEDIVSLKRYKTVTVGGRAMVLTSVKDGGKTLIARFAGVGDRTAAEALRGQLVEVDRTDLPPLAEGEYYHADLIGLPCHGPDGALLGTVVAIENFGAGDLIEVELTNGRRSLVPFRDPIAVLGEGAITIDPDFLA